MCGWVGWLEVEDGWGMSSSTGTRAGGAGRTLPGPFRSLLICSLYRASSPSSFLIFTSIEAMRVSVWNERSHSSMLESQSVWLNGH